jgi:hypothetical protein
MPETDIDFEKKLKLNRLDNAEIELGIKKGELAELMALGHGNEFGNDESVNKLDKLQAEIKKLESEIKELKSKNDA